MLNGKWILALAVALPLLSSPAAYADGETGKVGYVDFKRAIRDTSDGKKVQKELETDFNKKKKELEKREGDLKKMGEDLEKKAMVMSDETRAKKQQEFQQEMLKWRDMVGKSQMDIQKKEMELTKPIIDKLSKIIDDIAKKEGFSMVLEKGEQVVLWAKKDVDLTDRVIAEYEKQRK